MESIVEKYNAELDSLIALGREIDLDLTRRVLEGAKTRTTKQKQPRNNYRKKFESTYQGWYTQAHAVVRQIIPSRLIEFESLYKGDGKRKVVGVASYNIQDWFVGLRAAKNVMTDKKLFEELAIVEMRFRTQVEILNSAVTRFDSALFDIRRLLQANLFDSELEEAEELLRSGFLRASGAIAGVVLEGHLSEVCKNRGMTLGARSPSIGHFNNLLKENEVIDVPQWRLIQRMGDLRNLCDHRGMREPTKGEVEELVAGVTKITKTLS